MTISITADFEICRWLIYKDQGYFGIAIPTAHFIGVKVIYPSFSFSVQ